MDGCTHSDTDAVSHLATVTATRAATSEAGCCTTLFQPARCTSRACKPEQAIPQANGDGGMHGERACQDTRILAVVTVALRTCRSSAAATTRIRCGGRMRCTRCDMPQSHTPSQICACVTHRTSMYCMAQHTIHVKCCVDKQATLRHKLHLRATKIMLEQADTPIYGPQIVAGLCCLQGRGGVFLPHPLKGKLLRTSTLKRGAHRTPPVQHHSPCLAPAAWTCVRSVSSHDVHRRAPAAGVRCCQL